MTAVKAVIGIAVCIILIVTGCGKKQGSDPVPKPSGGTAGSDVSDTVPGSAAGEIYASGEKAGQEGYEKTEAEGEKGGSMSDLEKRAEEMLTKMPLRDKIYQMCIITPEQLGGEWPVTSVNADMLTKLDECPVGGIIFFADHLKNPEQTKRMLGALQEHATKEGGLPLFLCVDEEGGKVARIACNPVFKVRDVGPMREIKSIEEAFDAGRTIGNYLEKLGFNVDFAPDADVLTAPGSRIIGNRSFGDDPEKVTEYAAAVSDGLHMHGILSCFKHFPGHGAVEADTHEGLAYTEKSLDELMECEIIPFAKAEEKNVDMIMAAHISVPGILGDNTPCSLSRYMLTDVLRDMLGYKGLVVTDALNMGAVTEAYTPGESAKAAVYAGADIILMPPDPEAAVNAVEEAVNSGGIPVETINSAVKRILLKKMQF